MISGNYQNYQNSNIRLDLSGKNDRINFNHYKRQGGINPAESVLGEWDLLCGGD